MRNLRERKKRLIPVGANSVSADIVSVENLGGLGQIPAAQFGRGRDIFQNEDKGDDHTEERCHRQEEFYPGKTLGLFPTVGLLGRRIFHFHIIACLSLKT